ncbi:MAG: T9SS type A sorting domain-containing protein [bacterium]
MKYIIVFYCILFSFTAIFALEPAKANLEALPKKAGDEVSRTNNIIPYLDDQPGPGDIIGTTYCDYQANGSFGQRIMVDKNDQAHINWMKMDGGQVNRYCAWNARYVDSNYYGETQASPSWSGYVQLDITKDIDPDDQRTVIAYNYNPGPERYSWIDIDGGQIWGTWPNDPQSPEVAEHIWPYIAVANNNNIIMATGDYNENMLHLYVTADQGSTWTFITDIDSCATLSQFLRSSLNPGSNKVVFVWTQSITDTVSAGQLDNDVYYMLSNDGGVTWDAPVNITNYQPSDSVRAYCNVNAVFDRGDNLHIAWAGRKVTDNYYQASKIFHWYETNNTITVISSPSYFYNEPGGWWITVTGAGDFGAWRMPADQPQLMLDRQYNNYIYCFWHGNDDYNDYSAGGFINGEFFVSVSTDYGITWFDYFNFTNTRSPGAAPGACMDEDYMTLYPNGSIGFVWHDFAFTYIEDKDAGAYIHSEGSLTENPVRCYFSLWGVHEEQLSLVTPTKLQIYPNPFSRQLNINLSINQQGQTKDLKVYDITGRLIRQFDNLSIQPNSSIIWDGTDINGQSVPAGVYFVRLESDQNMITKKVIKLQ